MLLDGSVLWSMCFGREPRRCKPCRRCCRRRVSAARQRRRRCHRHAAALGLLLLLPLLGIVVAAPGAAAVLLAPLFLASAIRCWLLHVALWQWQAHCWRKVYDCNALSVHVHSFSCPVDFLHPIGRGGVVASCGVLAHLASAVAPGGWRANLETMYVHTCWWLRTFFHHPCCLLFELTMRFTEQ